ncbi:proteasome activator complex subunit 4 [Tieghemostelium lacteum]|uniref:Proteasome activator complex subunit 4 n=1 Tax=Tieghemostelium lacteum TaxID=361077 RepID=A0A151ZER2_TIELA|nr:proteasome activator complex subunit 4 [Tieghemostelium lacteum]|eukprot:KYQ92407.1 proteasome activator complex subunit 4 [Tieghemostelium lacteum]
MNIVTLDTKDFSYYHYRSRPDLVEFKNDSDEKVLENFKKRISRLYPKAYKDQIEEEQQKMYSEYLKLFDWSIQIADSKSLRASISQFTHSYMELKYPLLKDQYEYLIDKLFQLLFQYMNDAETELSIMTFLVILLLKGKRLITINIDWKPLYEIYKSHYKIDQGKTIVEDDTKVKTMFHKLVMVSRAFFKVEAFEEIHDQIKQYLVPHSNYIFFGLNALNLFLPTYHLSANSPQSGEVPQQIQEYMAIWNWIESLSYWDEKWSDLFYRFIKHGVNYNWRPMSVSIYTLLTRLLDVAIGTPTMVHVKPMKLKAPEHFKSESDSKYKYSCIGKIFVCLMNNQGDTMDLLKSLISKISIYFHPSNQGEWSSDLAEFLLTTCHTVSKRHNLKQLNDNIVNQFIEIVNQPLLNTLYSKKKHFILSACKIIKDLAYISPNIIFPNLINNFYDSFESEEEVNRVISTIEIMSTCFHPLIISNEQFPEGKTHVYNFMQLVITGLDPSYPNKSSASFKFFHRLFSCVLLSDETAYEDDSQADRTTIMSTSSFSDWCVLFIESVLKFILKVSKQSEDSKKREIPPGMFLQETLELFFSQMSDEIYTTILDNLVRYFTKTFEPDYYKQFGMVLKSAVLRDPKQAISKFLPVIQGKILSKSHQILELSDQEYQWYLTLLGYMVFKGGYALVTFKDRLMDILNLLMASDNKIIMKFTSKVVRKLIYSLSKFYPLNNRSVPLNVVQEKTSHIKYWGATSESIVYPIEWFEPTSSEIDFASDLIQKFLYERVVILNEYVESLKQPKSIPLERMKIVNQLKLINSVLRSAISLLPNNSEVIENMYFQDDRYSFKYRNTPFHSVYGQTLLKKFDKVVEYIYESLHKLLVHVREVNDEEVQILQCIAKTYLTLFHGKKDFQNPTNESLFGKWKNLRGLKTRNSLIFKAYKAHLERQNSYNYYQPIRVITQSVITDLLDLSVHRYREVRKQSQDTLKIILVHHPLAKAKIVIPQLLKNITALNSDSEIKGTIYLLSYKSIYKTIKENWNSLKTLIPILLLPLDQKFKQTTRDLFSEFKKKLIGTKYKPLIYLNQSTEMSHLSNGNGSNNGNSNGYHLKYQTTVPKEQIEKAKKFVLKKNQMNLESLHFIIDKVIGLLNSHEKKDTVNWKDHIYLLGSLIYYYTLIFDSIPNTGFKNLNLQLLLDNATIIKNGVLVLIKNMTSDYPLTRMLSLNIISQVISIDNPKYIEYCHTGYWDRAVNINSEDGDDKMQIDNPLELNVQMFYSTIINFFRDDIALIFNSAFMDKLIKFQLLDHDTEGINHKVSVTLSTKSLSGSWPNTRSSINVQYFKIPNAKVYQGLLNILGVDATFDALKSHMETLKSKPSKEELSLLSEIIAGIARYIVTGGLDSDPQRAKEILSYLTEVLMQALGSYSNECIDTYSTAIRYICHNVQYKRLTWLSDFLFKLYESSTNISTLSKSIHFLRGFLAEVSWKSPQLLNRMLEIARKEFSNPYKQVRSEACRLLIRVLNYQVSYPRSPSNGRILLEAPVLPEPSKQMLFDLIKEMDSPHVTEETKTSIKENLMVFVQSTHSKGFGQILTRMLPTLIKPILSLAADPKKEILDLSGICILSMSLSFVFDSDLITQILQQLELSSQSSFWKVRKIVLPFIQIFFFNHSIYMTKEQSDKVFQLVTNLIQDTQIEVREFAKTTLASILISSIDGKRIKQLMDTSIDTLASLGKTTQENLIKKHSLLLTLSSIILSNPYYIPSYFPKILDQLSRYSFSVQPIKSTCESTIIEFWRTHKDSFEQEKLAFSEEEIELMRSTKVSPTYYA